MCDSNSNIEEMHKYAAKLITQVLAGEITSDAAIIWCSKVKSIDETIGRVEHALYHYRDDEDLRKTDSAYVQLQENALIQMADRLAEGLPLTKSEGYW